MSALFTRILLWHKLLAMRTGGLALCASKRALNRDEARGWIDGLRAVADDIEAFLTTGAFVLDDKGQRVVGCASGEARRDGVTREARHVEPSTQTSEPKQAAARKGGGLRVATRKAK